MLPVSLPPAYKMPLLLGRFSKYIAGALSLAAVISCIATYLALARVGLFEDKAHKVLPLIYLDFVLLGSLILVITKRLVTLWRDHKKGLAGSRLHVKLVVLFSAIAMTPALLVSVFAALFFNVGVKAWFSEPVRGAIEQARNIAHAYLEENQNAIRHHATAIVAELRPYVPVLLQDTATFSEALSNKVEDHGLGEAIVFDLDQQVVARSYLTFALEFEKILLEDFSRAEKGELVIRTSENGDRVRALVRLDRVTDTYLYLGKFVDKKVLSFLHQAKGAVSEYHRLEDQRVHLQWAFIAFFALVALLLLLAAIWVGFSLAYFFVQPIQQLITAAESVRDGDLSVTVEGIDEKHELGHLADAFNRMIHEVSRQKRELVSNNLELEHRQYFIESVLSGVSAGIIGLHKDYSINLINKRAATLLHYDEDNQGKPNHLHDLNPKLIDLMARMHMRTPTTKDPYLEQMTLEYKGRSYILQVCVVHEGVSHKGPTQNYVMTFDDITSLITAQKKAAWSDVARRIAHEIKNPLTPIQLSAERLKRRYLKEIQTDPATFQGCIDTIIRQVSHIGKLVNEFSSFARMPEPNLSLENLNEICADAVFLHKEAHKDITFTTHMPTPPATLLCDAQQISQVIINLLKNAVDVLHEKGSSQDSLKIDLNIENNSHGLVVNIHDNGPGFPLQNRDGLLEPYITHREKGTGLGLAIVLKIVEDHGGTLELSDSLTLGGACVIVRFPLTLEHSTHHPTSDTDD